MQFLFNSRGQNIANEVRGHLHSISGNNIGHYREKEDVFIDMSGRYLGEIINNNRLVYNTASPYTSVNFGSYGNYGNVGNYGNPGNYGSIGLMGGCKDIEIEKLR